MTRYSPYQIAAAMAAAAADDRLHAHLADEPTYFTPSWATWDETRDQLEKEHSAAQLAYAGAFDGQPPTVRAVLGLPSHDTTDRARPAEPITSE